MDNKLRDEVIGLPSPCMDITSLGGSVFDFKLKGAEIQGGFPDLSNLRESISYMTLSEGKQAGITMYGDALFSIDAYAVHHFPDFAHFVASVIGDQLRRVYSLRGVELEPFASEISWKVLFGRFAKGVTRRNIFSGRKRLGDPADACRILSTGNEQLDAVSCSGSYATLFLQTS
ncbi:hypothetical protein ACLEPN_16640 [Myxococcus sp. 1LA]